MSESGKRINNRELCSKTRKRQKLRGRSVGKHTLKPKICKDLKSQQSQKSTTSSATGVRSTTSHLVSNRNDLDELGSQPPVSRDTAADNNTTEEATAVAERELEAEAIRLILLETKLAKDRAETMGAMGWRQTSVPRVNKQFARQALCKALSHNSYKTKTRNRMK